MNKIKGGHEISQGKVATIALNALQLTFWLHSNFLAALMWRKPLNSAALAAPMHREPKRMSDETSTQVKAWMINKWRAKIV